MNINELVLLPWVLKFKVFDLLWGFCFIKYYYKTPREIRNLISSHVNELVLWRWILEVKVFDLHWSVHFITLQYAGTNCIAISKMNQYFRGHRFVWHTSRSQIPPIIAHLKPISTSHTCLKQVHLQIYIHKTSYLIIVHLKPISIRWFPLHSVSIRWLPPCGD